MEPFISNKKICEIRQGDKNIDIEVILIKKVYVFPLKNDKIINQYLVGDETGAICCNFFDDVGKQIKESDILFLKGAYATVFKKHLVLYTAKPGYGTITKTGEFFKAFVENPNLSKDEVVEENQFNNQNPHLNNQTNNDEINKKRKNCY